MAKVRSGLLPVAGGFSQMISAGFEDRKDPTTGKRGNRRQFRLKLAIDESYGPPQARRALAVARLGDITAMRDALVKVGRGAQAAYLMRQAGRVAGDEEKFNFAIAAANVVMSRPSDKASEASTRFVTWGQLARAWGSQELARLYPNAGYGKKSAEATDEPRIAYLCKFIENVPLASFNDDDYWRAMRPARERCKTDNTFKAYAQVCRRVLKIGVELRIIPAWPLSAVCKLPIVAKGEAPEFPFLYPEEFARLMRCGEIPIEYRVLWGFIIREGLRLGEAFRIRWEHLAQLPPQPGMRARWVLNVPETKTGRALMFLLNAGSGDVLEALRRLRPELAGPFVWLTATNLKKAAANLRRHIELSGTSRERLLFTAGRLRRLREHDLRSTFVSWCKLGGIDNETIAQHTGHESSTMIARYNRSKATIEHLGLAPYLPLDQAMGLDVAGELGGASVPQLGAGELTTEPLAQLDSVPATGAEACNQTSAAGGETSPPVSAAVAAELGAAAAGSDSSAVTAAPGEALCPECERPMARVRSGGRNGWSCPSCNAAGEAEGDWLGPVTSPLQPPCGPTNGQLTGEGGADFDAGYAPGGLLRSRFPARRGARRRDGMLRGATVREALLQSGPGDCAKPEPGAAVAYAGEGYVAECDACHERKPVHEVTIGGASACVCADCIPASNAVEKRDTPEEITYGVGDFKSLAEQRGPLNAWHGCDPECDHGLGGAGSPVPQNGETSMFDASCAREGSNLHALRRWNLNPTSDDRNEQKPPEPGGEPAPEATGSNPGSHPGVTTPAAPLELLQAAARAYLEQRAWAALAALQPLIDAEVAPLAEAARAAPPEPVRLEVVRARKGGGK